ncbi:ammonium transporter AmtB-like domain-containing protein [Phascolomyces articulosus]|uniref:Ammonium transporter n=1 Tax=Phascolomyces articulosus TaxID=60185 RepID=A0AAD5PGL4_9FUNG|nr:ammonium transporter AmtB-like domain-containing protein [Phascolomyces articulosus]
MDAEAAPSYNPGDISWIATSMVLVWLMVPGLGYFYSGLASHKNALSLIMYVLVCMMVASIQWFIWGYSLTFSLGGNAILGNLDNAFLRGLLGYPSVGIDAIPDLIFCVYQCMFQCVTAALVVGAVAERARLLPLMIFVFVWSTLVYNFLAYWTWNPNGWCFQLGGLDFAGGTPVHIGSGCSALAYALVVGKRIGYGKDADPERFKAHNMSNVVLGTAFLWFGWFGFNGGSVLSSNVRLGMVLIVTNLAAAVGALTWMLMDYRVERKFSAFGFCSGAIAGLVAITPAAGFVGPGPAIALGFLGGFFCNLSLYTKRWLGFDDALDVFSLHGVGGYVGCIFTGVFAEQYVAALDGTEIDGGWMNQNWVQVGYQFADATAGAAWAFCMTFIICFIMNKIPGLSLRVSEEDEIQGLDVTEIGESAYVYVNKLISVDTTTGAQITVREEIKQVNVGEHGSVHTADKIEVSTPNGTVGGVA